jgi:uridylate kinase
MSSIPMFGITEIFDRRKAIQHMSEKRVVIFSGGIGNPLFTTDTAATLRAVEVNADVLLKATKVDGVYSTDPKIDANAEFFPTITYDDVINKNLKVMDLTAILLCKDHNIPIHVFNVNQNDALRAVISGDNIGTKIVERVEL